ncbi:glycosyltransferase family 2 protein [Candidatus Woesearchaeota archaeon]|nr:glycosyltransferase family 2 protein [Candidatus Woesearchaeota archaeon]
MKLSIIITSWKEPMTIGRAIDSFLKQNLNYYEIIVIAPDKETIDVAKRYNVKIIKDPQKGKPTALNIAFKEAKGQFLILTDGDVYSSENSVRELLKFFKDKNVGAVTGRPISLNPKDNIFGYWSHLLTDEGAHKTRLQKQKNNQFIVCSGYLYAIRNIIKKIPTNALSDDHYISELIHKKGYNIKYAPNARVFVKYPNNFKDWIKQKKRSAGGYVQINNFMKNPIKMRSPLKELSHGWYRPLFYAKTPKQFAWSLLLYPARLYLWLLIYKDIRFKEQKDGWERIESTKS